MRAHYDAWIPSSSYASPGSMRIALAALFRYIIDSIRKMDNKSSWIQLAEIDFEAPSVPYRCRSLLQTIGFVSRNSEFLPPLGIQDTQGFTKEIEIWD